MHIEWNKYTFVWQILVPKRSVPAFGKYTAIGIPDLQFCVAFKTIFFC